MQLERALNLIKMGQIGLDGDDNDNSTSKKRKINRYAGYTDAVWGAKTRGWAASTCRLDESKWRIVIQAAVDKMDWSGADEGDVDEGANGGPFDPCSLIEI